MSNCPLCSDVLLRHIRSGKMYWLCRRCRLEHLERNDLMHHPTRKLPLHSSREHLPPSSYDRTIDLVSERFSPITTGV